MRLIFALLAALLISPTAQAHYYAWNDAEYGFKLAFPDTWKMQGGLPANGRVRLVAPGARDASCTVFAQQDKRFTIYPRDYMTDVVAQEIQWKYWDQAVSNYDELHFYYDNFGALGAGDARYTLVDYIDRSTNPGIRKRAQVFATFYGDLHVMAMCAAPIKNFDAYAANFGQIIESIQMNPKYATNPRGYYRDFMRTKEYNQHWYEPIVTVFIPRKTLSAYIQCPRAEDPTACLSKPKPLPIPTR